MTTDQTLEQLITDRRAGLTRAGRRRARSTLLGFGWASSLGHRVAEHGLDGNEAAVAFVVRLARHHHVRPVAADALADRSLPDVVRERALGRVLRSLAYTDDAGSATIDQVA